MSIRQWIMPTALQGACQFQKMADFCEFLRRGIFVARIKSDISEIFPKIQDISRKHFQSMHIPRAMALI
ncbi:hypothetical protein ACFOKF_17285 [Sphingobium rhizovicinum]|uniref:Uncharacterized protein n=1 Tax=Sphingobium rhizovicinum TaxID=432308 RepID=A0ABV7NKI4_9SPHN